MSNAFICTLGTSISNGGKEWELLGTLQKNLQRTNDDWDSQKPDFEKELDAKIKAAAPKSIASISAEITVLARKGVSTGDKVVLLCSDGYLGRICGEKVQEVLVKHFGLATTDVKIIRVPDLQVHDSDRLMKFGLKNFVECARKEIENYNGAYTVWLCPNGGYKGVVPFLTLLGLQYHCKVLYVFELVQKIITLPPLPYCFDQTLYLRARRALAALTERVEMSEGEYLANIENYEEDERESFLGFVQYTRPGFVTPSSLVDTFVSASMTRDAMLSPQALKDLEREKQGKDYLKLCRFILTSQDPVLRKTHLHTVNTSDLIIIKTGHSSLRLLGYMANGRYYIARALQHDQYDQAIKKLNKADFPESSFTKWMPPPDLETTGNNLSTESELLEKNEALLSKNKEYACKLKEATEKIDKLEYGRLEYEEKINKESEAKIENRTAALQAQIRQLTEKIKSLNARPDFADAERSLPWYRKIFRRRSVQ